MSKKTYGWAVLGAVALIVGVLALRRPPTPRAASLRRPVASENRNGPRERQALREAVDAYRVAIAGRFSPTFERALSDALGRLDGEEGPRWVAALTTGSIRQIVREGWLERIAPGVDSEARRRLETALRAALRVSESEIFTDGRTRWARLVNAWGGVGDVIHEAARTQVSVPVPGVFGSPWWWEALTTCDVVYDLPAGTDPVGDPSVVDRATAARLVHGGVTLATWRASSGLERHEEAWRALFPDPDYDDGLDGIFPPHVPFPAPDGTFHGLAVAGGRLRPARDDAVEEAERFLDDAARLLPDAAHLDLLQQYFLEWVYDSPDVTKPLAIGCAGACGDIHQTAHQVLATVSGGVCRGDCDDFAELAWAVVRRQGHLAHVISVPSHLACVWAVREGDAWKVCVLQSGPTLCKTASRLPDALDAVFRSYEDADPVDVNALAVALRFDGENTRGTYNLSWRIFEDPEYARLMIDVQHDWSRTTLLQAIAKMQRVLELGDGDAANCSELAALYGATGQTDEALRWHWRAIEASHEGSAERVHRTLALVGELLGDERLDAARGLVETLITSGFGQLEAEAGAAARVSEVDLAGDLAAVGLTDLATDLLVRATLNPLWQTDGEGGSALTVADLLRMEGTSEAPEEGWSFRFPLVARIYEHFAYAAVELARSVDAETRRADPRIRDLEGLLTRYFSEVAFAELGGGEGRFRALEHPADFLDRLALFGRWRIRRAPSLVAALLDRVPLPDAVPTPFGLLEMTAREQLSWIRFSPGTFAGLLDDWEAGTPHPVRLGRMFEESQDAVERLGFGGGLSEDEALRVRAVLALARGDTPAFDQILAGVLAQGDRELRETLAGILGEAVSFLEPDAWTAAFDRWDDVVAYAPNYFLIAWLAIDAGERAHARHVVETVRRRFASDPALQHEARLLEMHLDGR